VIVADASAIIEILLRAHLSEKCADVILAPEEIVCAPYLLDVEVAHVLRRYARNADISPERGLEALNDLRDFPIVRYPHEPLLDRMWDLRNNLTAYDASYIALSEAIDAPLVTCDSRIARAHGHAAVVKVIE
jgi:predicted nucleic acid-binding protein